MRLGQHVDLTVVGQYVDIYIYIWVLLVHKIQEIYGYAYNVCIVNNFDLPL